MALNIFSKESGISKQSITIKEVIPFEQDGELVFRVINFNPTGYIVVSAEDNTEPVLGYGLNSNFDFKNIPPALNFLLKEYKREIKYIKEKKLTADENLKSKWESYSSSEFSTLKSYTPGNYLLDTEWGQDSPFNISCPDDPDSGVKCKVGCTAVALGQILNYWNCRVFPDGENSYTPKGFSSPESVNFYDQDYDWDAIDSDVYARADLLYHCGVAIEVDYTDSLTGGNNGDVRDAMEDFFGFQTSGIQYKSSNEPNWINMLKADIDAGRPIYYAGVDEDFGGHVWVVDGYKPDNTFHCNWGWANSKEENDEWYLLNDLSPRTYEGFTTGQRAILGAEPILDACSGLEGADFICESNESYSVSIPSGASVQWSVSNNALIPVGSSTNSTFTVASNSEGRCYITAIIKNSQNRTFLTRVKEISVGPPLYPNLYDGTTTTSSASPEYITCYGQPTTVVLLTVLDSESSSISEGFNMEKTAYPDNFDILENRGRITVIPRAAGSGQFEVRTYNECGISDPVVVHLTINSCGDGGVDPPSLPTGLLLAPNPATDETTLTLEAELETKAFDETVEWELEVYDNVRNLKFKKSKLRGKTAKIRTTSWREGVYMVRVKYKDKILTGKLVVKE